MTKIFENILVPYNGTANSDKAFRKSVLLASSIRAKVTILTCLEERATFGFFKTKTRKQEFEKERKVVDAQHQKLKKLANDHDVTCDSKIMKNGLASNNILEFAKRNGVDLIVLIKTKLSSSYEKQHYHSTVENVFRHAVCPVLIL